MAVKRMCRGKSNKGIIAVAFGGGLLLAGFCPSNALILILTVLVIGLGIYCWRC